jgi:hypothetical protein
MKFPHVKEPQSVLKYLVQLMFEIWDYTKYFIIYVLNKKGNSIKAQY